MKKRIIIALLLVVLFAVALFMASPSVANTANLTQGNYGYSYGVR